MKEPLLFTEEKVTVTQEELDSQFFNNEHFKIKQTKGQKPYDRAVGIDVHSNLMVCAMIESDDCLTAHTFRSDANEASLDKLVQYIVSIEPNIVAFESTGIYWLNLYDKLDDANDLLPENKRFEIHVLNAYHLKQRLGSKTDRNDAINIARCALFKYTSPSFVPNAQVRESKRLHRYLCKQISLSQQYKNVLHKSLKSAGFNASTVFSRLNGVAAKELILDALYARKDPYMWGLLTEKIDEYCARFHLKHSPSEIEAALHHSALPGDELIIQNNFDELEHIAENRQKIYEQLRKAVMKWGAKEVRLLCSVPGINEVSAVRLLAELGCDPWQYFTNVRKFSRWLGLAPGNSISANTHKSIGTTKGNRYIRQLITEIAQAASRTKATFVQQRYQRLKERRGAGKAIIATAHYIARVVFAILRNKTPYKEPEEQVLEKHRISRARRSINSLVQCGLEVTGELEVRDPNDDNKSFKLNGHGRIFSDRASNDAPQEQDAANSNADVLKAGTGTGKAPISSPSSTLSDEQCADPVDSSKSLLHSGTASLNDKDLLSDINASNDHNIDDYAGNNIKWPDLTVPDVRLTSPPSTLEEAKQGGQGVDSSDSILKPQAPVKKRRGYKSFRRGWSHTKIAALATLMPDVKDLLPSS